MSAENEVRHYVHLDQFITTETWRLLQLSVLRSFKCSRHLPKLFLSDSRIRASW